MKCERLSDDVTLYNGDCLDVMSEMEENSIDAVVTDPPYGLQFMGKEWDKLWRNQTDADKAYQERTKDKGDGLTSRARKLPDYSASDKYQMQEWHYRWAVEALRVAKPGAWLLAFGGTRTWHRLAVAIEDAGWELRDTIMWVYAQGFPKSHNVSKAIDKMLGAEREVVAGKWNGRGKGIDGNTFKHTTGSVDRTDSLPATQEAKQWDGWGTALKPAWEPVLVARKPIVGTVAGNVLEWGTGGINIDGCRIGYEKVGARARTERESGNTNMLGVNKQTSFTGKPTQGRFPANLIHDGSDEVLALFPMTKAGVAVRVNRADKYNNSSYSIAGPLPNIGYADSGSAARFFYCAKASRTDRNEGLEGMEEKSYQITHPQQSGTLEDRYAVTNKNPHPTVKPTDLMRYLCRLVTPPGGTVLDPFMGSGSTGKAAMLEGFNFVGIELDADSVEIARRRIEHARKQPRLV